MQQFEQKACLVRAEATEASKFPTSIPANIRMGDFTFNRFPHLSLASFYLHGDLVLHQYKVPLLGGHSGNVQQAIR